MSNQSKLLISLFVVAFDIGLVLYFVSSLGASPLILFAAAAFMVISSVHVVLIIWFGAEWHKSSEFRNFLRGLLGQRDPHRD